MTGASRHRQFWRNKPSEQEIVFFFGKSAKFAVSLMQVYCWTSLNIQNLEMFFSNVCVSGRSQDRCSLLSRDNSLANSNF